MRDRTPSPLVTMISKPIVPPWDDSAKNIVRSQVIRGKRYMYKVLTTKSDDWDSDAVLTDELPPEVIRQRVYSGQGKYSPSFSQNMRVFKYGLRPRGAAIYHYFFAPNTVSSIAGRVQKTVARVKTVQTVCSAPASFDSINRLLFSDMVVVLSNDTRRRMIDAGIENSRLKLVRPCIEPISKPSLKKRMETRREWGLPEKSPVVVFPGDYEFSSAAKTVARAVPIVANAFGDVTIVFACRLKTEASRAIRDRIRNELQEAGLNERVRFVKHVPDMPAFLGAAEMVIMPAESLYAKMDAPLVLLEAMSQEVPLVLADVAPLDELLALGAGLAVPTKDPQALGEVIKNLLGNQDLSRELGSAGAQAIREVFSADVMTAAYEEVYDEVLGR